MGRDRAASRARRERARSRREAPKFGEREKAKHRRWRRNSARPSTSARLYEDADTPAFASKLTLGRKMCGDPGMDTLELGGQTPRRLSRGALEAPRFCKLRSPTAFRRRHTLPISTANPMRSACAQTQRRRRSVGIAPTRSASSGFLGILVPSAVMNALGRQGADETGATLLQNARDIGARAPVGKRFSRYGAQCYCEIELALRADARAARTVPARNARGRVNSRFCREAQ
jgi:hypothetical protein